MKAPAGETVHTIGHSNRTVEELIRLLDEWRIETLVDIRRNPWSRRHPHFCRPALEATFEKLRRHYAHAEDLGGLRSSEPDSPNQALPEGLRGYADHTATPAFRAALRDALALPRPIAFMCAEASPANCHRSVLSDELVRQGYRVVHILESGRESIHHLDRRAVDAGSRLIYPSASIAQLSFPLG